MALTGFQQFVNQQPVPGKPGDWAGANIRAYVNGPLNGYVSDGTVVAGQFAWANPATGIASATYTAGWLLGFVQIVDQSLITGFLGFSNVQITAGLPVVLIAQGDVWCNFAAAAAAGAQVYATSGTGAASTTSGGNYVTPFYVVQADLGVTSASFTGVIAATPNGVATLTASAVTGTIGIGQFVSGTGVGANQIITGFVSGTYGGAGVYTVSNAVAVGSEAMTSGAGTVTKISTWQA